MKRLSLVLVVSLLLAVAFSASVLGAAADSIVAVRAIDYINQDGGSVQSPSGRAYPTLSHWDYTGHWLEWEIDVPADGIYIPAMMYGTGNDQVARQLSVDGEPVLDMVVFTTGDFRTYNIGYYDIVTLTAGKHIIRITNTAPEGQHAGINPAWIAFLPLEVLLELDDAAIIETIDKKLGF